MADPVKKAAETLKKEFGINIYVYHDHLEGGKGDDFKIEDLKKIDLNELIKGIKVEQEHSDNLYECVSIAIDHLSEQSDYYSKLETIHVESLTRAVKRLKRLAENVDSIKDPKIKAMVKALLK